MPASEPFSRRLRRLERRLDTSLTSETGPLDFTGLPASEAFHEALAEYHEGDALRSSGPALSDADRHALAAFEAAEPERCRKLLTAMAAEVFYNRKGGETDDDD